MIKTIKQYAAEKGITTQGVRQLKKIKIIELPIYARIGDLEIQVGKMKFVEV